MTAPGRVIDLGSDVLGPRPRHGITAAIAWLAGWSALVLAMAALVSAQKRIPFHYALASEAVNYYTLAALSLSVWIASGRMAERHWRWPRQAAAHVGLGAVLVATWQAVYGFHLRSMMGARAFASLARDTWMFQLVNACVLYASVVAVTIAVQAARRARTNERRQHEMALLARDAELRALMAQLEPHFLLNTLTSTLGLLDESPGDARLMLERLAEWLKAAFDEVQEPEITLGRELDLISAYLGIQELRFGSRLQVSIDVPAELHHVAVPPFLLQPLVENAVEHAVARSSGPATIEIRAGSNNAGVRIEVVDSGPGFDRASAQTDRHGLSLTERRLQAFAANASLRVDRGRPAGCTVAITLPP